MLLLCTNGDINVKKSNKPKWIDFGHELRALRKRNSCSRDELAIVVKKTPVTVLSWEQGYRRPRLQSILEIANHFVVPIQPLQALAGYTPEFDWYLSLTTQPEPEVDILYITTDEEKKELRRYLYYLRFIEQLKSAETTASV